MVDNRAMSPTGFENARELPIRPCRMSAAHLKPARPMFAGSLLVGFTIILVAVWLEYNDSVTSAYLARQEPDKQLTRDTATESIDARYQRVRRRWRLVIHLLLAICGALMIAAGWAGPGKFWIASWTAVAMLMLCILVLAVGDALRTHAHQVRKLAETRSAMNEKTIGK